MAEENQTVLVRCADLVRVQLPASLAQRAGRVAAALEAGERVVELPRGVSGKGLATATAYYEARAEAEACGVDGAEFDGEFVQGLTHDAAIDLIYAAHHLGDQALFNLFVGYRANCF
ncbi:hypothetical protein CFC21_071423 [Triticum aestivum]|uniref:Uncharacterized protein n=2 Tax=Triticum aestivum TaxID=4565 RepID=A0A9R1KT19_WHEAT|nr:hypothetical protein CFC21_071423 [Triticum aestivum]